MEMQNNTVSVIIPTYRRPDMLRNAIQSVLVQENCSVEIIVVDDNSCDETPAVVKDFPSVIYLANDKNYGPGYSRKLGLSRCTGKYVVFLDDDDYYIDTNFFSYATKILSLNKDYVFIACRGQTLDPVSNQYVAEDNHLLGEMLSIDYLCGISIRYRVPQTFAIVFAKEALLSSGLLNMNMVNHIPMIMRCLQSGKVFFSDKSVGVYRQHEGNISNNISADFIISNLYERHQLLPIVKMYSKDIDHNYWWLKQVNNTVSYYVYSSKPKLRDFKKVKKWCLHQNKKHIEIKNLFKKYEMVIIKNSIYDMIIKIRHKFGVSK